MGRACHGRLLRRARPRGVGARHRSREGGVAVARRGADPRARAARARHEERRAAPLHDRHGRRARARPAPVRVRGHAADLLGRRRPLARGGGDRRARRLGRPRARDEEHRAGGHRARRPAPPRRARLRVEPGVPEGGQRGRRLHEAGPRGGRRGRPLGRVRRPRGGAVRAARRPRSSAPTWPAPR